MISFTTESGSVYQVDPIQSRVRRLEGNASPLPRQGKDGEWKEYWTISEIEVGLPVCIIWDPSTTPLLAGSHSSAKPATITSRVIKVEESSVAHSDPEGL
jgi:hypothetical protein